MIRGAWRVMQKVIETSTGWQIKCQICGWHQFPKVGKPGASWTFNGDLVNPTFSPSMNEHQNPPGPTHNPECPTRRCHFVVTDGRIKYCDDCTHTLAGSTIPMQTYTDAEVRSAELAEK